ncbi:DUF5677 domain-containing protein [Pseudomonas kribbensis]|uniref:DUF5677 domain-containing protein n=1 Tax=Pseudomonas kribbensis TaxID=1628086 RepID=UPI003BF89616
MKLQELKGNAKCPCGTGKRYASCCKKNLTWLSNSQGEKFKRIPLDPEAIETLQAAKESYFRVFERAPKEDDPIFLGKYLYSEQDSIREIVRALETANVSPELIYAFKKTGRLVTKTNASFLTKLELQEWKNAVKEYSNNTNDTRTLLEELFQDFSKEYESCLICLGYFLEHEGHPSSDTPCSLKSLMTLDDYVVLCTTRSISTLRSVKALVDGEMGADALALCRNILENYLHIVFALSKPSELPSLVDAQVGLKLGTHEFAKHPNGKPNSRTIIRKSDGTTYRGHISNFEMANSSKHKHDLEVFDYFYSFLSDYTHPSLSGMDQIIASDGAPDPLLNKSNSEAIFYALCFSTMILDQLKNISFASAQSKSDISALTKRISIKAKKIINEIYKDESTPTAFQSLKNRLSLIPTPEK